MTEQRGTRWFWWAALTLLVLVMGVAGFALGWQNQPPLRLASSDWRHVLVSESRELNDCAECHEAVDYHTCGTCHDDHGALEFAGLPFYALVTMAGDVPEPGFVQVHEILPYQDQPGTHVSLAEFLRTRGVESFESVTLISDDGGFVTLEPQALTDRAWLLPYEDGIRFACEDLHVSSWLKGISRIVVVAREKPLSIDGESTSIGRLLLGPTEVVTVEQTEVSLRSEADGVIRKAAVASRLEGVPLRALFDLEQIDGLRVRTEAGETLILNVQDAANGLLVQFRGRTTLVLPERGRSEWITAPVAIDALE